MKAELWFRMNRNKRDWLSRIIAWRQSSPFVHVELVFPEKRLSASSMIGEGVRFVLVGELLADKGAEWLVIPLPVDDATAAFEWFKKHTGDAYDMVSILEIGVGRSPENLENASWYCSEACCEALKQCGLWPAVKSHGVKVDILYYLALGLFRNPQDLKVRIERGV